MSKLKLNILFWLCAVILISFILLSAQYNFPEAFFISCLLIPGILLAKYLLNDISFENKFKSICNIFYLALAILLIEYLGLFSAHWYLIKIVKNGPPDILLNPIFIWIIVGTCLAGNIIIEKKFISTSKPKQEKFITFISDRKKIAIELDDIKYIESNNDEVWIRTINGLSYRTKMKISHWETILDDRFLRVHRSFIINKHHVVKYTQTQVYLNDESIEVSRKYRETIAKEIAIRHNLK